MIRRLTWKLVWLELNLEPTERRDRYPRVNDKFDFSLSFAPLYTLTKLLFQERATQHFLKFNFGWCGHPTRFLGLFRSDCDLTVDSLSIHMDQQ